MGGSERNAALGDRRCRLEVVVGVVRLRCVAVEIEVVMGREILEFWVWMILFRG